MPCGSAAGGGDVEDATLDTSRSGDPTAAPSLILAIAGVGAEAPPPPPPPPPPLSLLPLAWAASSGTQCCRRETSDSGKTPNERSSLTTLATRLSRRAVSGAFVRAASADAGGAAAAAAAPCSLEESLRPPCPLAASSGVNKSSDAAERSV